MLYSYAVERLIRRSFEHVNNHNYDELLKPVASNVHHRFAGAHAIGGERHDKEAMRRWLERVGRVFPNLHIKVNDIWVKGGPWHTTVFVQWDATATLLNGDSSYFNRGFHVITMRWGKVYSLDVFEDSQEVARGLAVQAAASKRPLPNKSLANLRRFHPRVPAGGRRHARRGSPAGVESYTIAVRSAGHRRNRLFRDRQAQVPVAT